MSGTEKYLLFVFVILSATMAVMHWVETSSDAELAQLRLAVQMYQSQLEWK